MGWPYEIVDLTPEEKAVRRLTLDAFGTYAHFSAYVPVFAFLLYRLGSWACGGSPSKSASYEPIGSSARKSRGSSGLGGVWRRAKWWLSEPVSPSGHYGHRDEWIFGTAWFLWLFALCVIDTGTG